jgi:hypothetical protein
VVSAFLLLIAVRRRDVASIDAETELAPAA